MVNVCQNTHNYDVVSKALRQTTGEKELVTLDASAQIETFRHVANLGVTEGILRR